MSGNPKTAVIEEALRTLGGDTHLNTTITLLGRDAVKPAQHGPLGGMPLLVKDNIAVEGLPFTGGCPAFHDHVAAKSASVVSCLEDAGAVVVGKANLHELAFGVTSNNADHGPVRNPHDTRHVAGGSSGGSAAAVAAGFVPFALGTDTGGSGRIPAAFCGCVGYRPTVGRYPSDGVMLLTHVRDTISLLAQNMDDIFALDRAITGTKAPNTADLGTVTFGLLSPFGTAGLDPYVEHVFTAGLRQLEERGAKIKPVDGHRLRHIDKEIGLAVAVGQAAQIWAKSVPETLGISLEEFVPKIGSPDVRGVFESFLGSGGPVPETVLAEFVDIELPKLQKAYDDLFAQSGVDAFVFPTVVTSAPLIGRDETVEVCGEVLPLFETLIRNTGPGSLAGIPGVTLPLPTERLPVGFALDGRAGADSALLQVAAWAENALSAEGAAQ
ncbi:MAG: amidase family protein [Pseudomonadota bacterium]